MTKCPLVSFTYESIRYDTLDLENVHSCNYDLLAGTGSRDGKSVSLHKQVLSFKDLTDENVYGCDGW